MVLISLCGRAANLPFVQLYKEQVLSLCSSISNYYTSKMMIGNKRNNDNDNNKMILVHYL